MDPRVKPAGEEEEKTYAPLGLALRAVRAQAPTAIRDPHTPVLLRVMQQQLARQRFMGSGSRAERSTGIRLLRVSMDARVEPAHDEERSGRSCDVLSASNLFPGIISAGMMRK